MVTSFCVQGDQCTLYRPTTPRCIVVPLVLARERGRWGSMHENAAHESPMELVATASPTTDTRQPTQEDSRRCRWARALLGATTHRDFKGGGEQLVTPVYRLPAKG